MFEPLHDGLETEFRSAANDLYAVAQFHNEPPVLGGVPLVRDLLCKAALELPFFASIDKSILPTSRWNGLMGLFKMGMMEQMSVGSGAEDTGEDLFAPKNRRCGPSVNLRPVVRQLPVLCSKI